MRTTKLHNSSERPYDICGHVSTKTEFYRYIIVAGGLFVVNCYLYNDPKQFLATLKPADYERLTPSQIKEASEKAEWVGYSVWSMQIGVEPDYELSEWQINFLQILLFLKYTNPEYKYVPAQKKIGTKKNGYTNATNTNVTIVNSTWNSIVIREEGFQVSGHFRLQPCGPARAHRKLIWIDSFEKEGYIRKGKGVSDGKS